MSTKSRLGILILTPFYSPNIGGAEAHLASLVKYLRDQKGHKVYVITYQPLTTRLKAPNREQEGNLTVYRIKWFGYNWFPKLEKIPFMAFIYLFPGLFIYTLLFLLKKRKEINVLHAQGFVAGAVGRIVSELFTIRSVISTYAIYETQQKLITAIVLGWILRGYDRILAFSELSKRELTEIGVPEEKISKYVYWVDQNVFRPLGKLECRRKVGWDNKFVVLFVGRLIKIKGAELMIEAAKRVKEGIYFTFIVTGSYEDFVAMGGKDDNIIYIDVDPKLEHSQRRHLLNIYYNAADVVVIPSQYAEGFVHVALEALSAGTPILASKMGCLPEIVDSSVGELIDPPTVDSFIERIEFYYNNPQKLALLARNCVAYAQHNFSTSNAELIERSYYDS